VVNAIADCPPGGPGIGAAASCPASPLGTIHPGCHTAKPSLRLVEPTVAPPALGQEELRRAPGPESQVSRPTPAGDIREVTDVPGSWTGPALAYGTYDDGVVGLVGRDRELARLRTLVRELTAGEGRSVWLEGEPGIGKTALTTAGLAGASERGCRLFRARADQTATVLPLRLLLDLLQVCPGTNDPARARVAQLLYGPGPEVAAPAQPATGAVAELLVDLVQRWCAEAPVVLAADDLQWADEVSVAVWSRLQHLTRQLPLLLVAACRPVPRRDQLAPLRERADELLTVGPLDGAAVADLTSRLVGAAPGAGLTALAARAGGNPLYLEELLAALARERRIRVAEGVAEVTDSATPGSLVTAIAARLRFLSEPAVTTLRLAALLGSRFTVEHLTVVTGEPATALLPSICEAVAAGVLTDAGDALAFRHGLVQQTLVDATPTSLRHALHHQAACRLAAGGAPAEQVATQLLAARGRPGTWAAGWLRQAAPALVHRAPALAAAVLEHLTGAADPGQPGQARLDPLHEDELDATHQHELAPHHADALLLLGRFEQVAPVARRALERTTDPELTGRLTWSLVRALARLQRYDEALTAVDQILARRSVTPVWAARALAMRAMVLPPAFRFDEVEPAATAAEAAGLRVNDPLTIGYALQARVYLEHIHRRNPAAALALTDQALAVIGDRPEASEMRFYLVRNRAAALEFLDRHDEANRAIADAVVLAEQSGAPTRQADARLAAAQAAYDQGRWDEALTHLEVLSDLPLKAADRLWPRALGASIAFHRDNRAALVAYLDGIDESTWTAAERYHGLLLLIVRAVTAERDRQPARALAGLLAVFDPDGTGRFPDPEPTIIDWLPDVVRLALALDDRRTAVAATAACQDHADRRPLMQVRAAARHCSGLCHADAAPVTAAAEAYRRAGWPLPQARAREDAAVLYAQAGATAEARTAYTQAVTIYHDLGAAWDLRRADARLRPHGIRRGTRGPRRRPSTGWQALTPTELTVAHLVAEGHSNPDIATRLYLSRRTIETHVSHILTKLGAHSRVEIARHATRHAPHP
jgi:DNA-binding CsgD family transcriptional regulator